MAAKSSIRDVGRVLDLPLPDVDRVAKLVPTKPGTKLAKILGKSLKEVSKDWQSEDMANIKLLHDFRDGKDLRGETITLAQQLEGSVRNTGIHAAGVIIAPDDLLNHIPVCTSKESDLLVTQFDGSIVEDAGMLKMDFLGLKTLSIIKDAIQNIVDRFGEEKRIDPDEIPLDDPLTYEMIQRGEMIGIFQFESDGMQKHLKDLKPTNIEDLIAMNALYRPGPMDYIPSFIARKHGKEVTEYPHEWLEEMLKPTYGIMVYQEQIMQCAQIMADYSLGSADMLRRAMGKKKQKEMDKHNKIFVEGATKKGVAKEKAEEIFEVMAKFASYGFNRSHAAAYSVLAFQTAYLKAHYPAEFIASVLTHNKNDITKLNFFLREAKRMLIDVLGPDINESKKNFTVNAKGQIRFGMSALKGVGEGPVEAIIEERQANGPFSNIFDLTKRLVQGTLNRKSLESLALGGGFDSLGNQHRAQWFAPSGKYDTFIEHALKYGLAYQSQKLNNTNSLFGNIDEFIVDEPDFPNAKEWTLISKLTKEKEVTGIYISGHPLDDYRLEMKHFTTCSLDKIDHFKEHKIKVAGIVTMAQHKVNQKGSGFGIFAIQDFVGNLELRLFQEQYIKFKDFFIPGEAIFIEGVYRQSRHNDNFYFNVNNVRLLETVGQEMTKSLTLKVPLEMVNNEFIDFIDDICARRQGKHNLKLLLLDKENEISLNVVSKNKKINADSHMIDELEAVGILYKLN
jgi:DNA polymerase-3 subunit alpha